MHPHAPFPWTCLIWVVSSTGTRLWSAQGLSHYLEHMLFMGSKKYPDENEYDSYLTKHGGASNAFTELVGQAHSSFCITFGAPDACRHAVLQTACLCTHQCKPDHVSADAGIYKLPL